MPVEYRKILFSMQELQQIIAPRGMEFSTMIPSNISQYKLVEAIHTRDSTRAPTDRVIRLGGSSGPLRTQRDAVVFRGTHTSTGKDFVFFIPDATLMDMLLAECKKNNITVPRRGEKKVIAEDMYVGIDISINAEVTGLFELED